MAGIVSPSRISHHFGISKENGTSSLPSRDPDRLPLDPLVGLPRRVGLQLRAPLRLADRRAHGVDVEEVRGDLGQRAEDARLRVVLLEDPEAGEGRLARQDPEVYGGVLLVDVPKELARRSRGGHEQMAAREEEPIDRLEPVPGPRLHALAQRVIDADGDVELLWLVASHVLLELLLGVGHDREVLGRDPVSLGAVAVPSERDAPPPGLPGREHDPAGDPRGEVLLEDAPVDDLDGEMRHARPPAAPEDRGNRVAVCWSDLLPESYGETPHLSTDQIPRGPNPRGDVAAAWATPNPSR